MVFGELCSEMEAIITHVVHSPDHLALEELNKASHLFDKEISIDCTTITNHCICAENFEYFRKPDHVIQCLKKGSCFHCQRYKCMDRKYDTVTASSRLIHIAAAAGRFEVLWFLHRAGCSLETTSGIFELRPLHLAIIHGHFNIFCYLLAQKVDVNAVMKSHGTSFSPLMLAVKYHRADMVRNLLMVREINPSYRNSLRQSSVLFAVQNNDIDLVNLLLSAEDVHSNKLSETDGRSRHLHHPCAILETLQQDNDVVLKTLLDNGCPAEYVFQGYYWQTTALVLSAILNSYKCLEILVDYGANVDVGVCGTALQWALHLDWTESVNVLRNAQFKHILSEFDDNGNSFESNSINSSIDDKIKDDDNNNETDSERYVCELDDPTLSPLISIWRFVQWINITEPIRRLVEKGYDVNVQDKFGRTGLHYAVEEQSVSGVRALLSLGANCNIPDVCGGTPFWHAVYWNKLSMINELIFANVVMECSARESAYKIGLPPYYGVIEPTAQQLSTLGVAVKKNFVYTARLLLESGYDVSNEDLDELMCLAKPEVKSILRHYSSHAPSLFACARNFVRKRCARRLHRLVAEVELPYRVRDCLLLRDLIHLKVEPALL
ncbi:putative ankyrin repeat protein RF_0381 [Dreissena polymorpha]|uniref:Uncharacterized protein n=1 Tax=Dreissena polymorpha TaxID=45954 RepID=A0A9D4LVS0_DREPO|nr:putative ankyrin repeat protein RF_0381 [Dreissena polymorpha]XP_052263770.1 putative ankyrin repeat protein RF_0381 [Dreissena polymorpha]XP_052263771.1 putative ankyrin repeat protein RF_0381 [Dreissena polymorpha]KAH3864648.1 hypothetical protein DPMN_027671 [Dreissena polymorpha]